MTGRVAIVTEVIVWLIEGGRRVTGEVIFIDGGIHIASSR
jgi:enoyl-[acyl-carrier-protein] reductase (NADH)